MAALGLVPLLGLGWCPNPHYRPLGPTPAQSRHIVRMEIGNVPPGFLGEEQLGEWTKLKKSSDLGASKTAELPQQILALLLKLQKYPNKVQFQDVINDIDTHLDVTSTKFSVGAVESEAGENTGSAKILGLGKLASLSEQETLCLFGEHYRDVCADPQGDSHPNIRSFMKGGWECVKFPWGVPVSIPVDGKNFDTSQESVESALAASSSISGEMEWDRDSDIWIP